MRDLFEAMQAIRALAQLKAEGTFVEVPGNPIGSEQLTVIMNTIQAASR